jgi:hypothetical protein
MNTSRNPFLRRTLLGALLTLATLLVATTALAFGSVQLKSASLDEVDGRWKLDMDINYGGQPHMGHIPFDFVFTMTTYFEYSITDADKEPQNRRKPMVNQQPKRESVDIDFADARGKIWPRTKFQIALKRDREFEAGEYTFVIRRASDGVQMGNTMHLVLNGKNPLVDRRAIVFASPTAKDGGARKPKPAEGDDAGASATEKSSEPSSAKSESTSPSSETEDSEAKGPPALQKRPGGHGCGCRLAAEPAAGAGSIALLATGSIALLLRRRRWQRRVSV